MLLTWLPIALLVLLLVLVLWIALRKPGEDLRSGLRDDSERLARDLRDEVSRSAVATRQELSQSLATFQQTLLAQQGDVARTQNEQIDSFRTQLAATQQMLADTLRQSTLSMSQHAQDARTAQDQTLARFSENLNNQLRLLSQTNEQRLTEVRQSVEQKLSAIQADNEKKLEQMRATVDEKLHATLEQRLGESFKQVADRLEQVHKGLGEMQNLARDVGSLNRTLTNVKTRGTFGELQLENLLEQVFTVEQYESNVVVVPSTSNRVDFAIRLPGREGEKSVWLPIDAKFPREDYDNLLEAQQRADVTAVETYAKAIESRLKLEAKGIQTKYVSPPDTTDFAILFVPTEGLYAEALRRPGLVESMQRDFKVMLAGPTTLLALLNSLQMGFRTLALEKRSAEVWTVLGAVKTEFKKFGDILDKTKKKLDEASNNIDLAQTRTRVMTRKLSGVEALPESRAQQLLPLPAAEDELAADDDDALGVLSHE